MFPLSDKSLSPEGDGQVEGGTLSGRGTVEWHQSENGAASKRRYPRNSEYHLLPRRPDSNRRSTGVSSSSRVGGSPRRPPFSSIFYQGYLSGCRDSKQNDKGRILSRI